MVENRSPVISQHYTQKFYERLRGGARASAEVIAPLVLQLLPVRSLVDVGCGDGNWSAVFHELGVHEILGMDGEYVRKDDLQIPREWFQPADLSKPFRLNRSFDLAVCLEVAEHLPPENAAAFVESLTTTAPAVLFSAAVPHQGGDHHINERWPDDWASLFKRHEYLAIDAFRRQIWQCENVESWYAQNILLFVRQDLVEQNSALRAALERTNQEQLSLVHPRMWLYLVQRFKEDATRRAMPSGVIEASKQLAVCVKNSLRKRLLKRS